ncbi:MAG: hypothetical protein Q8Q31_05440 [Nanoarchaeota archaeon]|nr:hypothetical protein [Nanoarchaeota archaeon]
MVAPVNPLTTSISNYLEFRNQSIIGMGALRNLSLYAQFLGLWMGMSGMHAHLDAKVEAHRMYQEGRPKQEIIATYQRQASNALLITLGGVAVSGISCMYGVSTIKKRKRVLDEGTQAYREEIESLLEEATDDMVNAAAEQTGLQLRDPQTSKRVCPLFA